MKEKRVALEKSVHTAKLEKRNLTSLVSIHYEMMEELPHLLLLPQPFNCRTSFLQTWFPLISSHFVFTSPPPQASLPLLSTMSFILHSFRSITMVSHSLGMVTNSLQPIDKLNSHNSTQLSGKYTIQQLHDTHQRRRRTKGENIWIKRSPNTRDDQIQYGTHGHPLQKTP